MIVRAVGAGAWTIWRAAGGIVRDIANSDELARSRIVVALSLFTWSSMSVLIVLAGLTGLAAAEVVTTLSRYIFLMQWIESGMARTLAINVLPLLLGIFAAGRVAVGLAVRLGGMRLSHEYDALVVIGDDPVRYVITPALITVVISTPIQMIVTYAMACAAFAGALKWSTQATFHDLAILLFSNELFSDLLVGTLRATFYQILALAVGSVVGARTIRGVSMLSNQAMVAFTCGLVTVLGTAVTLLLL